MAKKEVDDRFKKFGTVSFTAITKTNDFVGNLEQGKITGTKCKKCGLTFFPPRADCYQCLASDMEWFEVSESKGDDAEGSTCGLQQAAIRSDGLRRGSSLLYSCFGLWKF